MADNAPELDTSGASTITAPQPVTPAASPAPQPDVDASNPNALGGNASAPSPVQQGIAAEKVNGPNWGARALHGILSGLGGTDTVVYTPGPDGKLVASGQPKTPGQQWKTIIAGALAGVGASAQAGSGPGATARGIALGASAGAQQATAMDDRARGQAQQNFENQQKQQVTKAQTSLIAQQTLASSFNLQRAHVDATNADLDRENEAAKIIQSTPGARDLGVIGMDPDKGDTDPREALTRFVKGNPELVGEMAHGNIQMVSAVKDGKVVGVHAFVAPQEWAARKTAQDVTLHTFAAPDKPGDPPKEIAYTIPAGSITNGDALKYSMQNSQESAKFYQDQFDQAQENARSTQKERATIQVAGMEANSHVQGAMIAAGMGLPGQNAGGVDGNGNNIDRAAELLLAHKEAPSMLSNRTGMKQAVLNRAAQLAQARGVTFSPEMAEEEYKGNAAAVKEATAGKTRDLVGSFNTFLGHAAAASNDLALLHNSNSPLLNQVRNRMRVQANTPEAQALAAFDVEREAAVGEWINFKNSGHATTKADEDFAATIADKNAAPSVQEAAIKALAHTGAIRLGTINAGWLRGPGRGAGDIPQQNFPGLLTNDGAKALQRFGIDPRSVYEQPSEEYNPAQQARPQQSQTQQQAVTPPAGATNNVLDAQGKLIGHTVGNRYVPLGAQ